MSVSPYNVNVVLNYGWCSHINALYKNESTVSNGDYENKQTYTIVMQPNETTYTKKVQLKRQCMLCFFIYLFILIDVIFNLYSKLTRRGRESVPPSHLYFKLIALYAVLLRYF